MKSSFIFCLVTIFIVTTLNIVSQSKQNLTEGEFMIDTKPAYTPTTGNQMRSDVAFDGTNFLVVWEDFRTYPPDIYAARVTQGGLVLDMGGIPICTFAEIQSKPSVEYDGTNYLVIWQDYRNGTNNYDIYGARVTPDGNVLDPDGFAITNAGNNQQEASLGFDGTNYLAVWTDYRSGGRDIYGARISPSGTVLDVSGIPICTAPESPDYPSVEFDGTNYLVVWEQFNVS
ncbi:MAG: hypothetical protein HXY48_08315 [Ignavibacteriaceae bacterium]|nr:hypothetical protein [Ignavibacteriaceae bacterium]